MHIYRFCICAMLTLMFYTFSLSSANKCLLKVGAYCAQLEQYQKAIEIYEQVCIWRSSCICTFTVKTDVSVTFLHRLNILRLEPTQWTTRCWNTAPRSISSKPPSVISSLTSSMLRRVYTAAVHSEDLGRGSRGGILTHCVSTDRCWKIRGDVPGFFRLQRVQVVEGSSTLRTERSWCLSFFQLSFCV